MLTKDIFEDEIIVTNPSTFDEVKRAAEGLKSRKPAIVNLNRLNADERMWAAHFLNGVVFAINGSSREIQKWIFLYSPNGVSVKLEPED
ncbi:MAG: cell division protein SepF [bacterium]